MKTILMLMTTGMSLQKWSAMGFLDRELKIYQALGECLDAKIYMFSYGKKKKEEKYLIHYPRISVLSKWKWFPNINIHRRFNLLLNILYQFLAIRYYKKIFRQIDIIKTNQFFGSDYGIKLKNIFHKKLIVRMGFYRTFNPDAWKSLKQKEKSIKQEKLIFPNADKIFVTTNEAKIFIEEKYNCNHKVHYMPNSIDTDLFAPLSIQKDIDILFVGRLMSIKNVEMILESLLNLNLKIVFIGQGKQKNLLKKYAIENDLDLTIIPRVKNTDLAEYYNRARIFILPSDYEGNPKVLLEAMSCGCTCIGSDVHGINNVIEHKKNGLLVSISAEDIRKTIIELKKDIHLQKQLGKNARHFIIENYSLKKILQKEVSIYKAIGKNDN